MNRIRYALYPTEASPVYFEDSPANIRIAKDRGAALSTHAYSQPLMKSRRPKYIWGDLHMRFDTDESEPLYDLLRKANAFLTARQVAPNDVEILLMPRWVEIIVAERSFRGEVGSPCRLQFDSFVQGQCKSSPMLSKQINGHHVEFTEFFAIHESYYFPFPLSLNPQSKGISCLSRDYYRFHNQLVGKKDLLTPKPAWFRRCSVLDALLKLPTATTQELAAICSLFQNRVDIFAAVLSLHGRPDLLPRGYVNTLKKEMRSHRPCLCADAPKRVSPFGDKFPCSEDCGVTSPLVLQFSAWPQLQGAPIGQIFGGCILYRDGLYLGDEATNYTTKVMEPVWIKQSLNGEGRELGSREVECYDCYGFQKLLTISEEDLNSPRLFAILRANGVHVPISKTEQGKIRGYLVSQFPIDPAFRIGASHFGWQQDNSYIDLNGNNIAAESPYRAKALAVPKADHVNPASLRVLNVTTDPLTLLAMLASLAGPVLKYLSRRGICVNFFGGTDAARRAILLSASSIWDGRVYPLREAKDGIRDLKRQYSDSTLCVGGATSNNDVRVLRAFVKRFFLGRKNSDEGVTAVIISAGEKPLAQSRSQREGLSVFTVGKDVLAIDIGISHSCETACSVKGLGAALIKELFFNRTDTLGNIRAEQADLAAKLQRSQKIGVSKSVVNFLWLFASLGYWAHGEGKLAWWNGEILPIVFQRMVSRIGGNESAYLNHIKLIVQNLPRRMSFDLFEVDNFTPLVDIGRGRVLVPSTWMKNLINHRGVLNDFLKWLRANKVLITQNGKNCGNYHHPQKKKTVRGYALRIKSIQRITAKP